MVNGDAVDGRHHGATSQLTQNLADQARIAADCWREAMRCVGRPPTALYWTRGTEAHVGPSSEAEEQLAAELGATPDGDGRHARGDLWLRLGAGLAHLAHHIGTTGSQAYETTALCKEYTETCADAARWGYEPPDWVVRSHRHRCAEVRVPTRHGRGTVVVTPGWQGRTPFAYRIPGGRVTLPQFGGVALIAGGSELYSRSCVYEAERSPVEVAIA